LLHIISTSFDSVLVVVFCLTGYHVDIIRIYKIHELGGISVAIFVSSLPYDKFIVLEVVVEGTDVWHKHP
jgi:hypothetical protein